MSSRCWHIFRSFGQAVAMVMLLVLSLTGSKVMAQARDSITVYVFLSEICPICQSNTIELKSLYSTYRDRGISFVGLFPNQKMSTDETRRAFEKKYSIPFLLYPDRDQKMTKQLAASTTPQIFVLRNSDQAVLYSGRVDNGFESIGRRRQVVTEHYLVNALDNILANKAPEPAITKPVGCFIMKN